MVTVAKKVLFILNIVGFYCVFFSNSEIFAGKNPLIKLLQDEIKIYQRAGQEPDQGNKTKEEIRKRSESL